MVRRILPLTLLLLLGLVAWLARRGPGTVEPATVASPPGEASRDEPGPTRKPQEAAQGALEERQVVAREEEQTAAPNSAVLALRVVAREDGTALADVKLYVTRKPSGTTGVRTGGDGWVELEVPPGRELTVGVWTDPGRHGSAERTQPALAEGQRVELELAVPTQPDTVFYGRLVDAESGEPVAVAVLHRQQLGGPRTRAHEDHEGHERGPGVTPVGADGRFRLELRTWDFVLLCVHAPGWSLATVQLGAGHDTPEREQLVRLVRSAQLAVDVLDAAARAQEGVAVRVTASAFDLQQRDAAAPLFGQDDPAWKAVTGRDGRVELVGLPARVLLSVTASRGREELRSLVVAPLEPGEVRSLELRLVGEARVLGEAVEANGAPLADVAIWLIEGAHQLHLDPDSVEPAFRTRTDAGGRFHFDDVPAGDWSVGVAPQGPDVPPEERLSSVATPFQVGGDEVVVRVVAHRGLFIEGTVLGPSGESVEGLPVYARSTSPWGHFDTRSGAGGSFTIAGLLPGDVELQARELGGRARFAPSPEVKASAGARGVVLRVESAASLSGRIVAPAGTQAAFANLMVSRSDGDTPLADLSIRPLQPGGTFEVGGLQAGLWGLSIATPDGLVGVLGGVALSAGQQREDLVLRLEPGAELRVLDALGEALAGSLISVHTGGACVGWNGVQPGATAVFRVPGARLRVLATRGGEIVRELEVDVLAGEVKEVVLE